MDALTARLQRVALHDYTKPMAKDDLAFLRDSLVVPTSVLGAAAAVGIEETRVAVAKNLRCPLEVLMHLIKDESVEVMEAALGNESLSDEFIYDLARNLPDVPDLIRLAAAAEFSTRLHTQLL